MITSTTVAYHIRDTLQGDVVCEARSEKIKCENRLWKLNARPKLVNVDDPFGETTAPGPPVASGQDPTPSTSS